MHFRRIRQLAEHDALEHSPKFNQGGVAAEQSEVWANLLPTWQASGWDLARPIERLWAGERDPAVVGRGCRPLEVELVGLMLTASEGRYAGRADQQHRAAHDGVRGMLRDNNVGGGGGGRAGHSATIEVAFQQLADAVHSTVLAAGFSQAQASVSARLLLAKLGQDDDFTKLPASRLAAAASQFLDRADEIAGRSTDCSDRPTAPPPAPWSCPDGLSEDRPAAVPSRRPRNRGSHCCSDLLRLLRIQPFTSVVTGAAADKVLGLATSAESATASSLPVAQRLLQHGRRLLLMVEGRQKEQQQHRRGRGRGSQKSSSSSHRHRSSRKRRSGPGGQGWPAGGTTGC